MLDGHMPKGTGVIITVMILHITTPSSVPTFWVLMFMT